MVELRNDEMPLRERIAAARGLDRLASQDVELKTEFEMQLVLPLIDEAARGNDQAATQIAANHELLDEQAGQIVFPAPGSSASKNRSGWRGSISSYTAVIWCGSGSRLDVWTAS